MTYFSSLNIFFCYIWIIDIIDFSVKCLFGHLNINIEHKMGLNITEVLIDVFFSGF